ncbi:MAG: lysophospholipid acyltransferase family protein [Hydrogenobaculum sp.]
MKCPDTTLGKYIIKPVWFGIKEIFKSVFKVKAFNIENIEGLEGAIFASNHRSHLDPPVLNSIVKEPLYFIAKKELFEAPVIGFLYNHMRAIPIQRGSGDFQAIEKAIELLNMGCNVCIFPEGKRAPAGEFLKPKTGIGIMVLKTKKPVVPIYIENTDINFPVGAKYPVPRAPINVYFGKPIHFGELEDNIQNYKLVANTIMEHIKELVYYKPT